MSCLLELHNHTNLDSNTNKTTLHSELPALNNILLKVNKNDENIQKKQRKLLQSSSISKRSLATTQNNANQQNVKSKRLSLPFNNQQNEAKQDQKLDFTFGMLLIFSDFRIFNIESKPNTAKNTMFKFHDRVKSVKQQRAVNKKQKRRIIRDHHTSMPKIGSDNDIKEVHESSKASNEQLNTDLEQTDNQIRDPSAISGNLK